MPEYARSAPRYAVARPYRTALLLAAGALTAFSLWGLIAPLAPILWCIALAAFFAVGLNPLLRRFQRSGLPRSLALAAVAGVVLVLLAAILLMVLPALLEQSSQLLVAVDRFLASSDLNTIIGDIQALVPRSVLDIQKLVDSTVAGFSDGTTIQAVSTGVLGAGAAIGNGFFLVVMVVVLTAYFLASGRWFHGQLLAALPHGQRAVGRRVVQRVVGAVGRYFRGQVVLSALNGALSLVLLLATGATMPFLFAAVALVCALIPLIGIPLGAAIIVGAQILAAPASLTVWVVLAIWYVLYMALEAYVISPRIIGRSVAMPEVMILLITLIGGTLYGLLGALLSVPVALAFSVTLVELNAQRRREQSSPRSSSA